MRKPKPVTVEEVEKAVLIMLANQFDGRVLTMEVVVHAMTLVAARMKMLAVSTVNEKGKRR